MIVPRPGADGRKVTIQEFRGIAVRTGTIWKSLPGRFRGEQCDDKQNIRSAYASLAASRVFCRNLQGVQLQGIIDDHAHSDPDNQPRRLDGLELAKEAKAEGMRGAVLKNHQMPTTQLAYMVNQLVPGFAAREASC